MSDAAQRPASPEEPSGRVFSFWPGGSEGDPDRADMLGGKGAGLAAMSRAGFPVPPGFTIAASCCAWVNEHAGRWPEGLEAEVRAALTQLEQRTQRTFGTGPRPLLVAVRSGAAVSMPGMMDTILNCGLHPGLAADWRVGGSFWAAYTEHIRLFAASVAGLKMRPSEETSPELLARDYLEQFAVATGRPFPTDPWQTLRQSIDAVFASWSSERARTYRQHHNVRGVVGTAVNVQAMFPSDRSGVLFTANPNSPSANEMVIEASWGLGEAVVSGAVTPDSYVLDADSLRIKTMTAGDRPSDAPALSEQQILELGQLGRRVEQFFGKPLDIEWGYADGQLVLLQARPIRGLDIQIELDRARDEEIARLRELSRVPGKGGETRAASTDGRDRAEASDAFDAPAGDTVVWAVHNVAETLPFPTPLTWDVVRRFLSPRGGYGRLYRLLGFRPAASDESLLELIGGRIYVDPRRAARMFFDNFPLAYSPARILEDPGKLDGPPDTLDLERADPFLFARLPALVWRLWSAGRHERALRRTVAERFHTQALPRLEAYLEQVRTLRLDTLDVAELRTEWTRRRDFVMGEFAAESLLPGYIGGLAHARVAGLLTQLFGPLEGADWTARLTTGLDGDVTVEQNECLASVARGDVAPSEFVARYGHRAVNEMELAQPRWSEDLDAVRWMTERLGRQAGLSPRERHARQVELRQTADERLPVALAEVGGASFHERIVADLTLARRLLPYREIGKFQLMRGYATLRAVAEQLGRTWQLGGDVYFLHEAEWPNTTALDAGVKELIARRKLRWRAWQQWRLPNVIDSRKLDALRSDEVAASARESSGAEQTWPARPLSSGVATGTVAIVHRPEEAGDLGDDYILVCPSTDPGWTPLFVHARGLIVERGGVLSHGAIVARDFGIPAVACENATRLIPDGARIQIDASRGVITLLERPGP